MTFRIAVGNDAVYVADAVEIGDNSIEFYIRAELGGRPSHEVVHLTRKLSGTVDTWELDRAKESTSAQSWPAGTPLALLPAGSEPTGRTTVNLAHPLASSARQVNLQGCYRRLKVGSEIVWDAQIFGERQGTRGTDRRSYRHTVQRGREGTAEADHAAGATVTVLGPGES